jgi:hypothetical protein
MRQKPPFSVLELSLSNGRPYSSVNGFSDCANFSHARKERTKEVHLQLKGGEAFASV